MVTGKLSSSLGGGYSQRSRVRIGGGSGYQKWVFAGIVSRFRSFFTVFFIDRGGGMDSLLESTGHEESLSFVQGEGSFAIVPKKKSVLTTTERAGNGNR